MARNRETTAAVDTKATRAAQPRTNSCPRCQGLLVAERFLDIDQGGFMWGTGWRCVNCGNAHLTSFVQTMPRLALSPASTPVTRQRGKARVAA